MEIIYLIEGLITVTQGINGKNLFNRSINYTNSMNKWEEFKYLIAGLMTVTPGINGKNLSF